MEQFQTWAEMVRSDQMSSLQVDQFMADHPAFAAWYRREKSGQPMTFRIELTQEQLSVVNQALVALPYKYAAPVINAINTQLVKTNGDNDAE